MKIGILCYPTFGGSGVIATELGMELANRGYQVHFITYKQPVRLEVLNLNIHFHEVFIEEYPLFSYQPYELALSTKIVEVTQKYNLDILHVHYAIPHAYAAYMAKQMLNKKGHNIKVITTLHGTDITLVGSNASYKTAAEYSINHSDAVTSVSKNLKEETLRLFDISKTIRVIYNFIDFKKYSDANLIECKRSSIAKENEKIITHISNFRKVKRVDDVINIFYNIKKNIPSKLILVGDGPERENVKQLSQKLGLMDSVIFLGNSIDVNKILCYSDIFLLPSQTESFGLVALEAMAAKTPVISTNSGGLPEVNIHKKTGFLSEVADVKDMSKNAIYVLKNQERLELFKRNAREHASAFSVDKIVPKYEQLYKSL